MTDKKLRREMGRAYSEAMAYLPYFKQALCPIVVEDGRILTMPRPRIIKALMVLAGVKPADIARELDVSSHAVSAVINHDWRSKPIEDYLAEVIGFKAEDLFGPHPGAHLGRMDSLARRGFGVNVGDQKPNRQAA